MSGGRKRQFSHTRAAMRSVSLSRGSRESTETMMQIWLDAAKRRCVSMMRTERSLSRTAHMFRMGMMLKASSKTIPWMRLLRLSPCGNAWYTSES